MAALASRSARTGRGLVGAERPSRAALWRRAPATVSGMRAAARGVARRQGAPRRGPNPGSPPPRSRQRPDERLDLLLQRALQPVRHRDGDLFRPSSPGRNRTGTRGNSRSRTDGRRDPVRAFSYFCTLGEGQPELPAEPTRLTRVPRGACAADRRHGHPPDWQKEDTADPILFTSHGGSPDAAVPVFSRPDARDTGGNPPLPAPVIGGTANKFHCRY